MVFPMKSTHHDHIICYHFTYCKGTGGESLRGRRNSLGFRCFQDSVIGQSPGGWDALIGAAWDLMFQVLLCTSVW